MATNNGRSGPARPQQPPHDPPLKPRRRKRPVLDQGIAINGELRVQLFGLNLLPIKVRLLVSSKETAAELGLDWWRKDRRAKTKRSRKSRPGA